MRNYTLSLILLFGLFARQSNAQQIMVSTSLKEAIDSAIQQSYVLQNQAIEVEKLDLERKSILNKYIPSLSTNAAYGYFNTDFTLDLPTINVPITGTPLLAGKTQFDNTGNLFAAGISAKAILFSGGQILNGAKAINAKKQGTALMSETEKNNLIIEVIHSFDQLRQLEEVEKLIKESELRLDKEKQRVDKAINNGLAVPYDRDKIKLAQLELHSKRFDVEGKKKVLYQKIEMLTHLPHQKIVQVAYELSPYLLKPDLNPDNRVELKALEQFKNAYTYNLKKEKGSLLPNLGAFGMYNYTSIFDVNTHFTGKLTGNNYHLKLNEFTASPNFMVGLVFKWDIFSGFTRKHKIDEAKLNIKQVENKIADTKEKIHLQLQNNRAQYETLLKRLEIEDQKEKIAKNNLVLAQKQYSAGLISITERLAAETDIYQNTLNKISTMVEQRKIALETLASTGNLAQNIQTK